jgi:hypothetical protein
MKMGGKKHEKNKHEICEKKHHKGSMKTSKKDKINKCKGWQQPTR